MHFQLPALRPLISLVMMTDVAEQETIRGLVDNQPDIFTHAYRREVRIPRLVEFMELQAWMCWIELQVKRRCLDCLLLLPRQPGKTIGKCVRNSEFHVNDEQPNDPLHQYHLRF